MLVKWELMNFAQAWPSDFKHHTYICKIPDKTLQHKDEHYLKYEHDRDGVLVKPIDSEQWFMNKTIITATNPDTNKPYVYIRAPFGCLEKIVNFSTKHYENLEKNIPIIWKLNDKNWKQMKLTFMGEYRHSLYLYGLLNAELSTQCISKQMIVTFAIVACLVLFVCVMFAVVACLVSFWFCVRICVNNTDMYTCDTGVSSIQRRIET